MAPEPRPLRQRRAAASEETLVSFHVSRPPSPCGTSAAVGNSRLDAQSLLQSRRSIVEPAVVAKVSLKGKEHALRSALATQWVAMTRSLAQASPVLKELIGRSDGQLTFLFSDPLAIPSNVTCQAGSAGWSSAVVGTFQLQSQCCLNC